MEPDRFPRPIHIAGDGDPLHAVVLDRLAGAHNTTMSISQASPDLVSAKGPAKGSRARGWALRQLELDGAAGLLRDARTKAKPGMRYVYSRTTATRAAARTRRSDEDFLRLLSITTPAPTVALPVEVGTLITFANATVLGVEDNIKFSQELRIHLGWPPQPGRGGVISALTHRNVDAICTVIEAIGPVAGYAVRHPPLGRDDHPDRIHQRLVALAADMVDELLRQPVVAMDKTAPPVAITTPLLDRGAVDSDTRSGRVREVINSVTRF